MATAAEWEAAKKMAQAGEDAEVIASSLGVSVAVVRRRLKDDMGKPRKEAAVTVSPHEAGAVIANDIMSLAMRLSRMSGELMDIAEKQLSMVSRSAPGDTPEEMTMANTFMVMATNAAKLPMEVAKAMSKAMSKGATKGAGQGSNDKGRYDFGG